MKISSTLGLALVCVAGLVCAQQGYSDYYSYGTSPYGLGGVGQGGDVTFVAALFLLLMMMPMMMTILINIGNGMTAPEPPIIIINATR